ncbi:hypothetical protein HPP92_010327 [Vanilla planifolia]|uniref:Uncharacterized protein n=1 Tax=Vanilla planifolia TaxID=51239 RepID=A0A835UXF3_VANPL|nr:hypothetical protein HPP92_010327 [Vanilla planifolia]
MPSANPKLSGHFFHQQGGVEKKNSSFSSSTKEETEEKNKRFREAVQKKLKLLAEVKFLRKKYGSLSNASWPSPCNMKKQAHKVPLPPKPVDGPRIPFYSMQDSLEERNHKSKEVSVRRAPKLLDLNQNGEEMEAFEVEGASAIG